MEEEVGDGAHGPRRKNRKRFRKVRALCGTCRPLATTAVYDEAALVIGTLISQTACFAFSLLRFGLPRLIVLGTGMDAPCSRAALSMLCDPCSVLCCTRTRTPH